MAEPIKLLEITKQLAESSQASLAVVRKSTPSTELSWTSTNLYVHSTHQLASIYELVSVSPKRIVFSVHGIASLTRDIMETHDAFVYLFVESVSKTVRDFRHRLYYYHGAIERESIAKKIGYNARLADQGWLAAVDEAAISSNAYFLSLPENVRNRLLEGKRAFYWHNAKRRYPKFWDPDKRDGVYSLLSNSVHCTSNGLTTSVGIPLQGLLGPVQTSRIAIVAAIQYFANIGMMFTNRRPSVRDKLPQGLIRLFQTVLGHDFLNNELPNPNRV